MRLSSYVSVQQGTEEFSMYENDSEAFEVAKHVWIRNWINRLGDTPEAWIEIPRPPDNRAPNPTGRAVLCW